MKRLLIWCTLVCIWSAVISAAGCAGTGFEKKTTLVPDSVSFTFGQSRYREEDSAYRGVAITGTWNFK